MEEGYRHLSWTDRDHTFTLSSRQAAVKYAHGREILDTSEPQGVLNFRTLGFQPFEIS